MYWRFGFKTRSPPTLPIAPPLVHHHAGSPPLGLSRNGLRPSLTALIANRRKCGGAAGAVSWHRLAAATEPNRLHTDQLKESILCPQIETVSGRAHRARMWTGNGGLLISSQ